MPEVLVAVVSWNTRDLLARCLESMAGDDRLEVWVVDNASTDGSGDLVRDEFPWVNLIASPENLGFGRAVNLAVERGSRTAWIACANADVALEPGALDAMLRCRADGVAPRLVLPDGSTQHSVFPFPTLGFTVRHNLGLARRFVAPHWRPAPGPVPWALGAFLMVRREAWPEFDEALWLYAEDLDLGWRLARAGRTLHYEPAARVRHESAAATSVAFGEASEARWQAATYRWMLLRRGRMITRAVAAVNVAGALARAAMPWREPWRRERSRRWARTHAIGLRVRLK